MKCKHHPQREAKHFCTSCGIPICSQCSEEVNPGEYSCFQCAMFQTVSGVGTTIKEKRERVAEKKLEKKTKWGPFHYFVIVSSSLILVMWGVIIFGGQKVPAGSGDLTHNKRAFLFMVDSAVKRYAHYEGDRYPEKLSDLVPRYLSLRQSDISLLSMFSYQKDPQFGYLLSYTNPTQDGLNFIVTAKGIRFKPSSEGGG